MRRLALVLVPLSVLLLPTEAKAEPPTRVWVFFTDHGRNPAQLEAELSLRGAELGPRTLARRSKVRATTLVDARDLLPNTAYVVAVEHTGAQVRVQSRWLNAVSVEADAEAQRALAALPFVRGLHPVGHSHTPELELQPVAGPIGANPEDYGVSWDQLALIGVPDLHDCGLTGAGVIMAVQDTGFMLDHQAYAGVEVIAAHDFLDDDDIVGPEPGDVADQHIHGTLVLATLAGNDPGNFRGVAPGVALILSKTENQPIEEAAEEDLYVQGLEWIEGMGADIFSGSLIYSDWYMPADFDGASAVSTVAIEAAVGNGLIVFTSMGNTGPNPSTLGAPADAAGAISMGAVNSAGQLADFSSRGPTADGRTKPDVVAPGWDVYTVDPATLDGYGLISGTSFSTPITAGVGALLLEAYPWLTPAEMAELLRSTASQADAPDNDWGYGIVDAFAAAELFCTCFDTDADQHFDVICGGDDCDDTLVSTHPGAMELCNGIDDDCDTLLPPEEIDGDSDDTLACMGDCDDTNPAIHPGAGEVCDNSIDDDCDDFVDALDPDCMPGPGDSESGSGTDAGTDAGTSGSASETDASETETASETGSGVDVESQGCACSATEPGRSGAPLALLLLGLVRRRRRRQRVLCRPPSRAGRIRWLLVHRRGMMNA